MQGWRLERRALQALLSFSLRFRRCLRRSGCSWDVLSSILFFSYFFPLFGGIGNRLKYETTGVNRGSGRASKENQRHPSHLSGSRSSTPPSKAEILTKRVM